MDNGFFDDHHMLGALFDLDHDGSLDFGEAMFMGAVGAAYIEEAERSSQDEKQESSFWDFYDDDADDDDAYDG